MERRLRLGMMGFHQARSPEGKRALKEKKNQLDAPQTFAGDDGAEAKSAVGAPTLTLSPFQPPPPHINGSKWVHRITSGPLRNSAGVCYGPLCVD